MIKNIRKFIIILVFNLCITNMLYSNENNVLTIGNKEAKVTVKVFSSLKCPHCADFHDKVFEK